MSLRVVSYLRDDINKYEIITNKSSTIILYIKWMKLFIKYL